jgi:hypothetical protein
MQDLARYSTVIVKYTERYDYKIIWERCGQLMEINNGAIPLMVSST